MRRRLAPSTTAIIPAAAIPLAAAGPAAADSIVYKARRKLAGKKKLSVVAGTLKVER